MLASGCYAMLDDGNHHMNGLTCRRMLGALPAWSKEANGTAIAPVVECDV